MAAIADPIISPVSKLRAADPAASPDVSEAPPAPLNPVSIPLSIKPKRPEDPVIDPEAKLLIDNIDAKRNLIDI